MAALVDPRRRVWPTCEFFEWSEFDGWEHADAVRVSRGQALVRDLLCPARRANGRIRISRGGWYFSTSGQPRQDVHGEGAAVDVVPEAATVQGLYEWMRDHLVYGELIQERDHVHATLPGWGGNMQALLELSEGKYTADPDAPPFTLAAVEAGLHTPGGMLLIAGAAVGLWRMREGAK